jgi:hypothetical protein
MKYNSLMLYAHNFAYISTVATGNVPGKYLMTGPGLEGRGTKRYYRSYSF